MFLADNVRLVNGDGSVDSSWAVAPADAARITWSWQLLADYRAAEPAFGWHLETRGDLVDWHDWSEDV